MFCTFCGFQEGFSLSVVQSLLWFKLRRADISMKIIRILISLYSLAYMYVKLVNLVSPGIEITEAVLQSEIISGLLFAICLADLKVFLRARGLSGIFVAEFIRIIWLTYGDDIVLLIWTWKGTKQLIEHIKDYCDQNFLSINTSKTNDVVFKKEDKNFRRTEFDYGQEKIKIITRYEYLGMVIEYGDYFQMPQTLFFDFK